MGNTEYVYRTFAQKDKKAVEDLVNRTFKTSSGISYWEWKYWRNPDFDPSLIAIAEKNGEIVGCNHWLVRDIKLSSSQVGKAILCCDIAVDPNHRKHGVGKSLLLFLRSSSLSNAKGAVVNYMFTEPELNKRLMRPTVGYIPIRTSTLRYGKLWGWRGAIHKVKEINMDFEKQGESRGKRIKSNFKVVFQVIGAPALTIEIDKGRIEAFEQDAKDADVRVKSDLSTIIGLKRREKRLRGFLKALLMGKLKLRGSLFGMISLYRNLPLLEEIFGYGLL